MDIVAPLLGLLQKDGSARDAAEVSLTRELHLLDCDWRAANDLSVGQIDLYDNPLLREPLTLAHGEPLVAGLPEVRNWMWGAAA